MGRWIRRGYYPTWILRLFRYGTGRCEDRQVNEHLMVEGKVGYLRNDFVHEDRRGLTHWLTKHIAYARREAEELLRVERGETQREIPARFWGTQAERKRWIRQRVWNRLPPLVRPWLYYVYRLVLRGGFLDGWQAIAYHTLHALWFPFLIDLFYLEARRGPETSAPPEEAVPCAASSP